MESTSLRRTAVVLALLALPACGQAGPAGAAPSGSSSTSAAAPSETGDTTASGRPSATPAHRTTRGTADHGKPTPAPAAASGMCRSRDLALRTEPDEGGSGMGHAITRLVFQNTSGHACWVRGYPGVSYVTGDDGRQVGGAARRDRARPPSAARIWLIPNAHAYALLDQANPRNYPAGRCDPTAVRGLRVYPPEETASLYVPDKGEACADGGTGRPMISALSKSPDQPPG